MKKLFLFLLFPVSVAHATAYTSTQSGNWNTASTWGGAGVPGNNDTITVIDGTTVTVTDDRTVGTSTNTSTSINLKSSGRITIVNGGFLHVRGNTTYDGSGSAPGFLQLLVQAGGTWEFDSSQSTPANITNWTYTATGGFVYSQVRFEGTAGNYAVVKSNANGGAGRFKANSSTTISIYALYTYFNRVGDATLGSFDIDYRDAAMFYNVQHSSWIYCGKIMNTGCCGVSAAGAPFIHNYNYHVSTADTIFGAWLTNGNDLTATRSVSYNVFDVSMGLGGFYPASFVINGNYLNGTVPYFGGSLLTWLSFSHNFIRSPFALDMLFEGSSDNNLWFLDGGKSANPHGPSPGAGNTPQDLTDSVADTTSRETTSVTAFWITANNLNANNLSGAYYNFKRNIILPNSAGDMTWWMSLVIAPLLGPATFFYEHNTEFVRTGESGLLTRHPTTGQTPAGELGSLKSNIFWSYDTTNEGYKTYAYGDSPENLNPCYPADCDYNGAWNINLGAAGFAGGNGYADNFTSIPGVHDVNNANPQFVDRTRNTASFDSAYLGHVYPTWNSGTTYNVGDFVSASSSTLYGGQSLNYRYVNGNFTGTPCLGTNPTPGDNFSPNYAKAHSCWEWASVYDIREAIGSQTTFNDASLGVVNGDIITLILQWIRAGFKPQNRAYIGSAHDGTTIGAVQGDRQATMWMGSNRFNGGITLK